MADGYNFDKKTSLGETMNSLLNRQDALIRERQKEGKLGTMEKVMGLLGILSIVDGVATKNSSIKTKNMLDSPELIKTQAKTDFLKGAPNSQLIVDYGKYYNPNDKEGSIRDISKHYVANADKTLFSGTGYDPSKDNFEDLTNKSQETIYNSVQPTASSIYTIIQNQGGQALLEPYTAGRTERQREFVNVRESQNNFIDRVTNKITGNQNLFSNDQVAQDFLKGKLIYNEDKSALVDNPDWVDGGVEYAMNKFVKLDRLGALPDFTGKQFSFRPTEESREEIKTTYKIFDDGRIEAYDTPYIVTIAKDRKSGALIPDSYKEERVPGFVPDLNDEKTLTAATARLNIRETLGTAGETIFEREIAAGNTNLVSIMAIATNEVKPLGTGQYETLKEFDTDIRSLYNSLTSNLSTGLMANMSPRDTLKYTDISFGDQLKGDLASYVTAPYETFKALQYQQAWTEGRLDESVKQFFEFYNEGDNKYGLMKDDNGNNIIDPEFDVSLVRENKQYIINDAGIKEAIISQDQMGIFSKLDEKRVDQYFRSVTGRSPMEGDVFPANFNDLQIIPYTWNNKRKEWIKPTSMPNF